MEGMQVLESIRLALQTIWGNKLRSVMTVLGNIVAVTSIVTVVSLIQGMNAMVSNAIVSQVGADAFTIERVPFTRTDDDIERVRANPLITLPEADAIRSFSPAIRSVMALARPHDERLRGGSQPPRRAPRHRHGNGTLWRREPDRQSDPHQRRALPRRGRQQEEGRLSRKLAGLVRGHSARG